MKQQAANDIKSRAVTQAIETIRNRIDQLGVSEPIIQEHGLGQYQILVQLPGVDDPARVKEIMQSTAMLEIKQVLGGPYPSEADAVQQNNGLLPPDSMLLRGSSIGSRGNEQGDQYYLVTRSSAVSGGDLRSGGASVGRDSTSGAPDVQFTLTNEGGRKSVPELECKVVWASLDLPRDLPGLRRAEFAGTLQKKRCGAREICG